MTEGSTYPCIGDSGMWLARAPDRSGANPDPQKNHWSSLVWDWMEHGGLHISANRKLCNVVGSGARRKRCQSRHMEIIGFLEYAMAIVDDCDGVGDANSELRWGARMRFYSSILVRFSIWISDAQGNSVYV